MISLGLFLLILWVVFYYDLSIDKTRTGDILLWYKSNGNRKYIKLWKSV